MSGILEKLERLARAATPGPWRSDGYQHVAQRHYDVAKTVDRFDAAYIAAANPVVVLDLVARLRAAETERDQLRERLDPAKAGYYGDYDEAESVGETLADALCERQPGEVLRAYAIPAPTLVYAVLDSDGAAHMFPTAAEAEAAIPQIMAAGDAE